MKRYAAGDFTENRRPTIGADFMTKEVVEGDQPMLLQVQQYSSTAVRPTYSSNITHRSRTSYLEVKKSGLRYSTRGESPPMYVVRRLHCNYVAGYNPWRK